MVQAQVQALLTVRKIIANAPVPTPYAVQFDSFQGDEPPYGLGGFYTYDNDNPAIVALLVQSYSNKEAMVFTFEPNASVIRSVATL